ncbi:MAG TPA: c-type cytochrome, partial [Acidimicrobiia bacterium]|nr:c-type cytochrome [Acidimicrobiia bacterium]
GQHRSMPQWAGVLSDAEIDQLAQYTVDPTSEPGAEALFTTRCSSCHGAEVPRAADLDSARTAIATGGAHIAMPVWGDVLTPDQLDALVAYTEEAAKGTGLAVGQKLYQANCVACHGEFGEGGPLPGNPARILAPISTLEFLTTRDDATIRAIISKGQPDLGMSPFSLSAGGALADEDINALVGFIRSWQADPPVEFPPEIVQPPIAGDSDSVYLQLCAQCHGVNGLGGVGPSFVDQTFQAQSDEQIFATIRDGHNATAMIAWGDLLTSTSIFELVDHLRGFGPGSGQTATATFGDVNEIFQAKCAVCHGAAGGWDASSYDTVMQSGDNAPVVIPGDPDGSLLVQKLRGTQTEGGAMPPGSSLSDAEIAKIVAWITAGATQ